MTKTELNTLQKLIEKEDTKGKKLLERVVWLNTTKPKYTIGDCYAITDKGHYIYGVPVINMNAKILDIHSDSRNKLYHYDLELIIITDSGIHKEVKVYINENDIGKKVKNNINKIVPKDKYPESIGITLDGNTAW